MLVEKAKENRIQHDPKLFADSCHQSLDTAFGKPDSNQPDKWPDWKLLIVGDNPPYYLLRSPFWCKQPGIVENGGFIKLTSKQLYRWSGLGEAALEQANVRVPDKIDGYPRLLQRLLDRADRVDRAPETNRLFSIMEFIWDVLSGARDGEMDDDGYYLFGSGSPLRLQDGRIILKINWLLQRMRTSGVDFEKNEILDTMRDAIGMETKQFGPASRRTRWWVISTQALEKLRNAILSVPVDSAAEPAPDAPSIVPDSNGTDG